MHGHTQKKGEPHEPQIQAGLKTKPAGSVQWVTTEENVTSPSLHEQLPQASALGGDRAQWETVFHSGSARLSGGTEEMWGWGQKTQQESALKQKVILFKVHTFSYITPHEVLKPLLLLGPKAKTRPQLSLRYY